MSAGLFCCSARDKEYESPLFDGEFPSSFCAERKRHDPPPPTTTTVPLNFPDVPKTTSWPKSRQSPAKVAVTSMPKGVTPVAAAKAFGMLKGKWHQANDYDEAYYKALGFGWVKRKAWLALGARVKYEYALNGATLTMDMGEGLFKADFEIGGTAPVLSPGSNREFDAVWFDVDELGRLVSVTKSYATEEERAAGGEPLYTMRDIFAEITEEKHVCFCNVLRKGQPAVMNRIEYVRH